MIGGSAYAQALEDCDRIRLQSGAIVTFSAEHAGPRTPAESDKK